MKKTNMIKGNDGIIPPNMGKKIEGKIKKTPVVKAKKKAAKTDENIKETEIVVILDRSGSMRKISAETVDGFNTFLDEQKNAEGEAFITLIQFDDRYEVDYKSVPVKEAHDLILNETYVPRGKTALYESIGRTINELDTNRDVVFVIITDGQDNVRSEFRPEAIKKMIETLQDDNGWKFLFLAANQDAFSEGGKLGVKMSNSMSYAASGSGVTNTFQAVSANIGSYRSAKAKFVSKFGVEGLQGPQGMQGAQGVALSSTLGFTADQMVSAMDKSSVVKETNKVTLNNGIIIETTKESKIDLNSEDLNNTKKSK